MYDALFKVSHTHVETDLCEMIKAKETEIIVPFAFSYYIIYF